MGAVEQKKARKEGFSIHERKRLPLSGNCLAGKPAFWRRENKKKHVGFFPATTPQIVA